MPRPLPHERQSSRLPILTMHLSAAITKGAAVENHILSVHLENLKATTFQSIDLDRVNNALSCLIYLEVVKFTFDLVRVSAYFYRLASLLFWKLPSCTIECDYTERGLYGDTKDVLRSMAHMHEQAPEIENLDRTQYVLGLMLAYSS